MVGHVGLRDARIWIQSEAPCRATIVCWADSMGDAPTEVLVATEQELRRAHANTATFDLGDLQPGTGYRFQVLINDERVVQGIDTTLQRFTTQP